MPTKFGFGRPWPWQTRSLRRAETVLFRLGVRERRDITRRFDDLRGISGLGPRLANDVYWALHALDKRKWNRVFRWIKDNE